MPKRGRGQRKPKRTGKPVHVYVPPQLRDALDQLVKKTRRQFTTEVIIALEEHLKRHNMWPDDAEPAAGGPPP